MTLDLPRPNPRRSALVVDDDELLRDIIGDMLRALGIQDVQVAVDGRNAMQALAASDVSPDFVVCDVFMPEADGIELLKHLASMRYTGGVVIMSGGDARMLQISARIALANGLNVLGAMTKPVQSEQMARVLGLPTS